MANGATPDVNNDALGNVLVKAKAGGEGMTKKDNGWIASLTFVDMSLSNSGVIDEHGAKKPSLLQCIEGIHKGVKDTTGWAEPRLNFSFS